MSENKFNNIYLQLQAEIQSGIIPPGRTVTEVMLAKNFQVSRQTIRHATAKLERDGLLKKINGRGCIVCSPAPPVSRKTILVIRGNDGAIDSAIYPEILKQQLLHFPELQLEYCFFEQILAISKDDLNSFIQMHNICGILGITSNFKGNEPLIGILKKWNVPVILTLCKKNDILLSGFSGFGFEFRSAWQSGLEYLAECGHRRVITIGSDVTENTIRDWPRDKYRRLLNSLGLDNSPDLQIPFNKERCLSEDLLLSLEKLLTSPEPPTAIYCYSSIHVSRLYQMLRKLGKKVPKDICVLGFLSSINHDLLNPPLSAVAGDFPEMFRRALQYLLHPGNKNRIPQFFPIPVELQIRASTCRSRGFF